MIVNKEGLLCEKYKSLIESLEVEYNAAEETEAKKEILNKFSQNYLMIKELWDEWLSFYEGNVILTEKLVTEQKEIIERGRSHFYFHEMYPYFKMSKILHLKINFVHAYSLIFKQKKLEQCVKWFKFPFKNLEEALEFYKEYSSSPVTKDVYERYQKMKNLYDKIIGAEKNNDIVEWFHLITKADDQEFVINNVEYRLGKNLNNQQLWKMYIQYMRHNNHYKKLLNLYSLYCRYFITDLKTLKEYKEASNKYAESVCVKWKNPFNFEIYDNEKSDDVKYPYDEWEMAERDDIFKASGEYEIPKTTFEIYLMQSFSLPKTIMQYIIANRSLVLLHKLQKSCKYFFSTYSYPVCHQFFSSSSPWESGKKFYQQSVGIYLKGMDDDMSFDNKFTISNSIHVRITQSNFLSKILQNVIECEAKYIRISFQNLTFEEFKLISKQAKVLYLYQVTITTKNNENITLQDILAVTSSVVDCGINPTITNLDTFGVLKKLNFNNFINIMDLKNVNIFNVHDFCDFLKVKVAPSAKININFISGYDRENVNSFRDIITKEVKLHWHNCDNPPLITL